MDPEVAVTEDAAVEFGIEPGVYDRSTFLDHAGLSAEDALPEGVSLVETKEAPKPKPAAAKEDPPPAEDPPAPAGTDEVVGQAVLAVRDAWSETLKDQFPLADYSNLGIEGIAPEDKAKFAASVQASHENRVKELEALGMVFDPDRRKDAQQELTDDEKDRLAKAGWGTPVAGASGVGADEQVMESVRNHVAKGDTVSVIETLVGKGGLGKFVFSKKR